MREIAARTAKIHMEKGFEKEMNATKSNPYHGFEFNLQIK